MMGFICAMYVIAHLLAVVVFAKNIVNKRICGIQEM